ncbi:general transcription factor II H, polypeptide 2 [Tribonema minus]|uniref:General transcription factor IIH subunit n=1 Tax=Tribonema minus TaxID=303371 RepID=A0A835ZF22_9STRA|nr:general transcription factor II H, polypeptide 2 [Tribonema minus]
MFSDAVPQQRPPNDGEQQESGHTGYAWEKSFERSWEDVQEDEQGNLKTDHERDARLSRGRRTALYGQAIKRGMIRYVFLCIDLSKGMSETDMRPNRLAVTTKVVAEFVRGFFDQNPLSQLGIIITRDGRAERVTDLSGNPKAHIEALARSLDTQGEPSLQNLLELTAHCLASAPEYGSREAVVLYGSLHTCDPGNILDTIALLKRHKVRCSVVGLGAEVYIARRIAEDTGGDFVVAVDEHHYKDSLLAQCTPPPTLAKRGPHFADLVEMGFPRRVDGTFALGYSGRQQTLTAQGYYCPRCKIKTTELPSTCEICALPLVSSPHLARSYHHLFPVPPFDEQEASAAADTAAQSCEACLRPFAAKASRFMCPNCKGAFCLECDMYIHDSLHNCPGCC